MNWRNIRPNRSLELFFAKVNRSLFLIVGTSRKQYHIPKRMHPRKQPCFANEENIKFRSVVQESIFTSRPERYINMSKDLQMHLLYSFKTKCVCTKMMNTHALRK